MSSPTNGSASLNSSCNPFEDRIYAIVAGMAAVSGFISFIASCFIIFIIILFKKWRSFIQRLIFYLSITAALNSLALVLQRVDYENQNLVSNSYLNFCEFSGFSAQITSWFLLNAVTSITVSLTVIVFFNKQPEKYEFLLLLYIFIFPFTFNWIPFIRRGYGKAGAWCWIRSQDESTCEAFAFGRILQLVLWYGPLYVIMVLLIIMYVVVVIKLKYVRKKSIGNLNSQYGQAKNITMEGIKPLLSYPLIFFLINIFPFINRIHGAINPENPEVALWFLSAILLPLQGGFIAVSFSLDPDTRRRLKMVNFRAAFTECFREKKVKEYPIKVDGTGKENDLKQSLVSYEKTTIL